MSNPNAKGYGTIDPTAGVRLVAKTICCDRCGVAKRGGSSARPGLCRDCLDVLPVDYRVEWKRAA